MVESKREALIKEYEENKQLDMLSRKSYSYKPPNSYKTVFMTLMVGLGISCFGLLMWVVGRESGKDSSKR